MTVYNLSPKEPPRQTDIEAALRLILALGDVKATTATLKRLSEATAAHTAAASEAEEKLAELDRKSTVLDQRFGSADAAIAQRHAAADKRISDKEADADERLRQRETALANREAKVAKADADYVKRFEDLDRRMKLLRQAGAA